MHGAADRLAGSLLSIRENFSLMFGSDNKQSDAGTYTAPVVQGTVVQGEPVAQPVPVPVPSAPAYDETPLTAGPSTTDFNGYKGEIQGQKFNDVPFAIAFVAHLAVMLYMLVAYAIGGGNGGDGNNYDYSGVAYFVSVCGVFAAGLSTVALGFMMKFSTILVKMALFFSIGLSLGVGIMGLVSGQILMGVMGLVSFALGICYAYFVWGRIPFAAANLNTALSAVKSNMGLAGIAYFFLFVAFGWSVWWSVAAGGAMNGMGSGIVFLFLVSYYWTHQVIQNTVHVTVAGVIGTWWFVPDEASSCCSPALKDSFVRATTYSFGSICFGSLLVALVQALRTLQHMLRENDDFNFLVCIIDCILACIESIIEYLNTWAYVYVGLYGYSYLDAGRNVITLFQNKGWTTLITDNLAQNVLFMMSAGIGLVSGLVGLIVAAIDKDIFTGIGYNDAGAVGFL